MLDSVSVSAVLGSTGPGLCVSSYVGGSGLRGGAIASSSSTGHGVAVASVASHRIEPLEVELYMSPVSKISEPVNLPRSSGPLHVACMRLRLSSAIRLLGATSEML